MSEYRALHPGPSSAAIIRDIFELHFRGHGALRVLDLTWGRGTFWRWPWPAFGIELTANDIVPIRPPESVHVRSFDFVDGHVPDDVAYDVVVVDPPFSAMGPASKGGNAHSERYGASRAAGGPRNINAVFKILREGIYAATALAGVGIIVKTQAVIESGKYWDSPYVAKGALLLNGWRVADEVYFAPNRRKQPPGRAVQHFRYRPSVFIVAKP